MNDPWDVKSVRQFGQYVSCMKLNGVPLLPPVLSKECRKEMQYYKLLAREVEKRITLLQPYVESDNDTTSTEDKTDAPELPESEHSYEIHPEDEQVGFNLNNNNDTVIACDNTHAKPQMESAIPQTNLYSCLTSNVMVMNMVDNTQTINSPKFVIDLCLSINETGKTTSGPLNGPSKMLPSVDEPERDYNCLNLQNKKDILMDTEILGRRREIENNFNNDRDILSDSFPDVTLNFNGPSSLSSKSFTGSLNDINTESARESHIVPKLVRQRSYTLLKPSPQLLAHLEVQSLNAGVEMSSISMSESLSNLSTPGKKRRSWDLETAKVKWSNMALELKQKNLPNGINKNHTPKPTSKKISQASPPRARSVVPEKPRRGSVSAKVFPKSEPVQKPKRLQSPMRNISNRTIVMEPKSPKLVNEIKEPLQLVPQLISEAEDPATRVRELYEKIQKQQLVQMASLVEKQKKEQKLLQQVFEEQNNLLYKQLKTICPTSTIEAKEAWVDQQDGDRGPVSLSQLINHKSPDQSIYDSPVSSTLTDTNNCLNHCDSVLKKSRDLSGSIKKHQQPKQRSQNGSKIQAPKSISEGSRTRTNSPIQRNTPISRRLNYDTSASSEREYDLILTDRTNDTMADLNVTFPSDHSDEYNSFNHNNTVNHLCGKEVTVIHKSAVHAAVHHRSAESALKHIERILPNSKSVRNDKQKFLSNPTPQQREAASRIVAHAKGFLVRRLMRTERVQGIVQTIKDALLCALQLHQDREGIRGADVDLHRRLIQQITAACYSLHDTFIASTPAERCAMITADRGRRRSLAARQPVTKPFRQTDI